MLYTAMRFPKFTISNTEMSPLGGLVSGNTKVRITGNVPVVDGVSYTKNSVYCLFGDRLAKRVEIEQSAAGDIVINCWSPPLFSTCHEIDILPLGYAQKRIRCSRASLGICQFKNYQCVRKECDLLTETQCNQLKGCKFVDQQCKRDEGAYQVKIKLGICGLVETIVSDKPFLYYPTPAIQGELNPTSLLFDKDIENFNSLAIPLREFGFQLNVSDQNNLQPFSFDKTKFFFVRHDSIDDFTVNDDNTVGAKLQGDYLPLMFSTLPTTRRYTMQPGGMHSGELRPR